ncbi:MAG: hypothetical protein ACO1OO_10360 [Flavisolibacter sp.]
MKHNNNTPAVIHRISLTKRMLVGAGIGLILISIFLYSADAPHPEWPANWMLKPFIVVPIAGAMAGMLNYNLDHLRFQGGVMKAFAIIISLLAYVLCLWLGMVLGLNGTMWN